MYSAEIELGYKVEVEEPAQPVIDKLRATQRVNRIELVPLVRYMFCQTARTPLYRDYLMDHEPPLIVKAFRDHGIDPADYDYDEERIRSMFRERFGTQRDVLDPKGVDRCATDMGWVVMQLGSFGEFITSDNPVCYWSTRSDSPLTGIIFPISPKLTLIGSERNWVTFRNIPVASIENPFRVKYQRVGDALAQFVNDTVASRARRYLFGISSPTLLKAIRPRI